MSSITQQCKCEYEYCTSFAVEFAMNTAAKGTTHQLTTLVRLNNGFAVFQALFVPRAINYIV